MADSTFNPDANPETNTVDGFARRGGVNETWADITSQAGTVANDSDADALVGAVSTTTADKYSQEDKAVILFNVSSLAGQLASAVTLTLYILTKVTQMVATAQVSTSNPASNTAVASGDYAGIGTAALSNAIALADLPTSATQVWTLNATGIAAVNAAIAGTGIVKLSVILNAPTWVTDKAANFSFATADSANDPVLTVTHAAAPVSAVQSPAFFM